MRGRSISRPQSPPRQVLGLKATILSSSKVMSKRQSRPSVCNGCGVFPSSLKPRDGLVMASSDSRDVTSILTYFWIGVVQYGVMEDCVLGCHEPNACLLYLIRPRFSPPIRGATFGYNLRLSASLDCLNVTTFQPVNAIILALLYSSPLSSVFSRDSSVIASIDRICTEVPENFPTRGSQSTLN